MPPVRHKQGILDTNVIILLHRLTDPQVLPEQPLITAITLAELSVGPLVARTSRERAVRQAHVQQAEADFTPLPFDAAAARAFGQIAATLHHTGRKRKARSSDVMIAAIGLARDLPIYTANPADFEGMDGVAVVAVPTPPDLSG